MHRVSLTMPAPKPEVWCASTADSPVVVLTIPGVLDRTRVFDVDGGGACGGFGASFFEG